MVSRITFIASVVQDVQAAPVPRTATSPLIKAVRIISFDDSGSLADNVSVELARDLVKILTEAKQVVPPQLAEVSLPVFVNFRLLTSFFFSTS